MNISNILRQDHAELLKVAKAMCTAEETPQARQAYAELKVVLEAHSRAEEAVVYTALDKLGLQAVREATREGEVEHGLCDHLMESLQKGRADSALWKAQATVVFELLEHHIEEEHKDMLPLLEQHFDADQQAGLGLRFEQRKRLLMAQ